MSQKNKSTIDEVEERYGDFANQVISGKALDLNVDGYAPQSDKQADRLAERLYTEEELIDLPSSVVDGSIGCGNPFEIANLLPGETVLDLGSGGGIDCFIAAKAVGESGQVIGVDSTPKMIELANQNKEKMGLTNVEFRLGPIEKLPVKNDTIDLIISNCVIDVSADKESVFQEAFRVLKPDGRLAISDTVILGEIPPKVKANIDIWAGAVITPLISLAALINIMSAAQFTDIQVDSLTSYGLENFDALDQESKMILTKGVEWRPLAPNTGLFSATIFARKPAQHRNS